MPKSFSWTEQLAVGEAGERRFVSLMRSFGQPVTDLRQDTWYRKRDIDYRVGKNTVEVKTDMHSTGNVFIELVGGSGKPGCIFASRADMWAYLFPLEDTFYFIRVPELLLWLIDYSREYERKAITSHRGKRKWTVLGIAIPVKRLLEDGVAHRYYLPPEEEEEDEVRVCGPAVSEAS